MAQRIYLLHAITPFAIGLALGLSACGDEAADEQAAAEDMAADMDAAEAADMPADEPAAAPAMTASGRTPAPADATVFFADLTDGATVTSPVTVTFGATGIGVVPAGDQTEHTGHHHLLIDTAVDTLDLSMPIPNDANHMHFGMAQTGVTLELAPGPHTLQLVMGDWTHIPHDPVVASEPITITVE